MGLCNDSSNTFLRDVGYNVVRLPRQFLPPLSLIGKQGGAVEVVGMLDDLITQPGGALPSVTNDQIAATINGQRTSSMKLSVGLSILNGLIAGLAGGKLGASIDYTNARKLTFQFNNVLSDSTSAAAIGNFLRDGDVDVGNPLFEQYVLGNGQLFVVTERLRSNEITVSFEGNAGVAASVDVPVIANQVGGNVAVTTAGAHSNAVNFKGTTPITFAFKCFQIGVKNGDITLFAVKPGAIAVSLGEDETVPGVLLTDGMVDISGETAG